MSNTARAEFSPAELEQFRQRRIERIERDGAIRRHPCPKCGARPGEDCFTRQHYTAEFHKARKLLVSQ